MANKFKTISRIDVDIEKCREEGNWIKVLELAENRKRDRSIENQYLSDLLIGEALLEHYLETCPPIDANINQAKTELNNAREYLHLAINELAYRNEASLDAHLLLGKLSYACGEYAQALNHLNTAGLMNLAEKTLPLHSLRILAESYAVRGLCLKKTAASNSRYKRVEQEIEIGTCFDRATDLCLLYMQELETTHMTTGSSIGSHSPLPVVIQKDVSLLMGQALQSAPTHLMCGNQFAAALERYRNTLSAIETAAIHNARLQQMCELTKCLLHGLLGSTYVPPSQQAVQRMSKWKPKIYNQLGQFVPENVYEEIILLLLIAESIAAKGIVLSQSPEFKENRLEAFRDVKAVYDLFTVATVRWKQTTLLQESLERSLKFSFNEPHLWKQHALTLISNGHYLRALYILKEVIRLEPVNSSNCLLAAKLCYKHLNLLDEGLQFSTDAVEKDTEFPSGLLGRCYLYVGIGYYLKSQNSCLKKQRHNLQLDAVKSFTQAVEFDGGDHLAQYYLGLQYATMSRLDAAESHVKQALALRVQSLASLQLFILLLTAKRQYTLAVQVVANALCEHPDSLTLMYVKAHLELHSNGAESALAVAKEMLQLWKTLYEDQMIDFAEYDQHSETAGGLQLSEKNSTMFQQQANNTLSEHTYRPLNGGQSVTDLRNAWKFQIEIWLFLADVYLKLGQLAEVQQCIQEASAIYPQSHQVMHMKGLLHAYKREWKDAEMWFKNAVCVNPRYNKSYRELGLVYYNLEMYGLAETTFREAVKIDSKCYKSWFYLGKALEACNEFEKASNAIAIALCEEYQSPVLQFCEMPLCFE